MRKVNLFLMILFCVFPVKSGCNFVFYVGVCIFFASRCYLDLRLDPFLSFSFLLFDAAAVVPHDCNVEQEN